MVPVVRFLDYSHDEDGPWCGANNEGKVFTKWWLGTDGTYFGIFLESPWPFVMAWTCFGFSSMVSGVTSPILTNNIASHYVGKYKCSIFLDCSEQHCQPPSTVLGDACHLHYSRDCRCSSQVYFSFGHNDVMLLKSTIPDSRVRA